jgi:DNA invertase Pin-like site-specific DNA recombinase
VRQLCDVIDLAKQRRLKLVIGTFVVDCTNVPDVMTEGMLQMMGVFAEMERRMTVERVKSGLANARAKGVRLGRPPLRATDVPRKARDAFALYRDGVLCKTDYARMCGISRPTLDRYIALMTDG